MEMLNLFKDDLSGPNRQQLINNLIMEGTNLPKNLQSNMLEFPHIIKIEPAISQSKFVKNRTLKSEAGTAKEVFIFDAWQKGLKIKDLMWSAEEQVAVK